MISYVLVHAETELYSRFTGRFTVSLEKFVVFKEFGKTIKIRTQHALIHLKTFIKYPVWLCYQQGFYRLRNWNY